MNTESKGDDLAVARRQALLDRLSALGECKIKTDWLDCKTVGIGPELIPELIGIAIDEKLLGAPRESPLIWTPIHAWRALAGLRAVAAIEPLITLLRRICDPGDDWVSEEMPRVFGKIGPAAIRALTRYMQDAGNGVYPRVACVHGLQLIAANYPDTRNEVVAILSNQLTLFKQNDPDLNAFLISYMIDLQAVEVAPLMEQAFAADCVELFVAGDWEDVQVELGLLLARKTRPKPFAWLGVQPREPALQPPARPQAPSPQVAQANPQSRQARRKAEREAAKKRKQSDGADRSDGSDQ
jgi:hypothetical protein